MDADIEYLVHSGKLFGNSSRSSSPDRSASPAISFASDPALDSDSDAHSDVHSDDREGWIGKRGPSGKRAEEVPHESIGMGPGRTGVKGVIRDEREAQQIQAAKRQKDIQALRKRMENAGVGGKTYLEEERERKELEGLEEEEKRVRRDVLGRPKDGRFGHLREVGKAGFVGAVESEDKGVWVVVHLYDPSLDRCYDLDDKLSKFARLYPQTKFLRARAASLGFATTSAPTRCQSSYQKHTSMPGRFINDDEDDPFGDDDQVVKKTQYCDDEDEDDEVEVDTDMLPTLLVYRDGQLVHNWVRVDWEAGKAGVEDLLARHHIIASPSWGLGSHDMPPGADDDLIWSDEDNVASY